MDGVGPAALGDIEQLVDDQIRLGSGIAVQAVGLVSGLDVQGVAVGVRVDGNALQASVSAGSGDPNGDFSAVGNQDFSHPASLGGTSSSPVSRLLPTSGWDNRVMRLILASASPSRLRLLRAAGIEPEVVVSGVDEEALTDPNATPEQVALTLAEAKAVDVAAKHPGRLVLGADSVLDVDGESLGKPLTEQTAVRRWEQIRGRSAALITGHCLIHAGGTISAAARTTVHFASPDDEEVAAYVATGEPLHVAGGFTLDGYGSAFVEGIEGDPANVIGLGIPLLRRMVREAGLNWTDLWDQAGETDR